MMAASASVRARVAVSTTLVFAVALVLSELALAAFVGEELRRDARADGTATATVVDRQLRAGVGPAIALHAADVRAGVLAQVRGTDGAIVMAGPGAVRWHSGQGDFDVLDAAGSTPAGWLDARFDPDRLPPGWAAVQAGPDADGLRAIVAFPYVDAERAVSVVHGAALLVGPVFLLLVAGAAWVMAGRALRPVMAIATATAEIGPTWRDARVPVPGTRDEVAALATAVNQMVDRIDAYASRQEQLVADASHELRTPLAALRAELEVALAAAGDGWRAHVARALHSEQRLEGIVAQLLLLARLDAGASETGAADLGVVVTKIAVDHPSVTVRLPAAGDAGVAVPEHALERAVRNLIDNAVRHAERDVVVTVTNTGDEVELGVDDDGPGIPEHAWDTVFDRFARLDAGRGRADGGAGLGLAITKAVVDAASGRITIGRAPMGGTRVAVALPCHAGPRAHTLHRR